MKHGHCYLVLIVLLSSCFKKKEQAEKPSSDSTARITVCYSPKTTDAEWYSSGKKAPMLDGLKGIDFKITTSSPEAQAYFNQGLMLSYGFNHAEAARSFYQATRLDSTCAMAYWGYAYVLGPNYNAGMEPDNFQRAWAAAQKAEKLSAQCTPKEKALIGALTTRYTEIPPANRAPLDIAFAAAMKKVYDQFPSDPEADSSVVAIKRSGILIRETDGRALGQAPDHLLRLFAYNHIMRQLGGRYLDHSFQTDSVFNAELIREAETAHIVTPVSSMIVLETQQDYDRFDIRKSKNSLDNATLKTAGAVPEPHEWLLIILFCTIVGYFTFRHYVH